MNFMAFTCYSNTCVYLKNTIENTDLFSLDCIAILQLLCISSYQTVSISEIATFCLYIAYIMIYLS